MINKILDTFGFSCAIWVAETELQWHQYGACSRD